MHKNQLTLYFWNEWASKKCDNPKQSIWKQKWLWFPIKHYIPLAKVKELWCRMWNRHLTWLLSYYVLHLKSPSLLITAVKTDADFGTTKNPKAISNFHIDSRFDITPNSKNSKISRLIPHILHKKNRHRLPIRHHPKLKKFRFFTNNARMQHECNTLPDILHT